MFMKKSVLVTSILFSTMMFGGQYISVNAATVSNEQETKENSKVYNNIVLITQKGEHVAINIEGEVGKKYNLYDLIPHGYEIKGDKYINIISDVEKIRYVNVEALYVENILNFVDRWGDGLLGTWIAKGYTGDEVIIPDNVIPKGYSLIWGNKYTLSGDNTNYDISISRKAIHEESVAVIFNFYDENNNFVEKQTTYSEVGSKVYVPEPDNYKLAKNQPLYVIAKESGNTFNIKLIKDIHNVKLSFKDENGINIFNKDIESDFDPNYPIINVENLLGQETSYNNEYILDDNQPNEINVTSGGHYIVKVKHQYRNIIEFVDLKGNSIGYTEEVRGSKNQEITVSPKKGFSIIGNNKITIHDVDKYVHRIVLKGEKTNFKIQFKVHNDGGPVESIGDLMDYVGITGEKVTEEIVPEGYALSYDQYLSSESGVLWIWIVKKVHMTINFVDALGRVVSSQKEYTGKGADINLNIPKGYKLVNIPNNTITAAKNDSVRNILVVPANGVDLPEDPTKVTAQINLINQNSNKTIHSYIAQGKHGQKVDIQLPDRYELAKGSSKSIVLDKSKKSFNIYVIEKSPVTSQTAHLSTVQTKQTTSLFDKNGKQLRNRALAFNTGWKTDQKLVLNGVTYYRVGNNEYVKASDIVEYEAINKVVNTTSGSAKYLYDINGKKSSLRALASGSAWFSDKVATINGEKMYRVATNEWVKASDVL
jgi:aspartate 1-decarboxylase